MSKAHLTAIARKNMSVPTKWLLKKGLLGEHILDYGCGKGADVEKLQEAGKVVMGYDPHHRPNTKKWLNKFKWNTVICNYVLNVVDEKTREKIINYLLSLDARTIYVAVRRDLKEDYVKTSKGTEQWMVYLDYPVVHETSSYCIYQIK